MTTKETTTDENSTTIKEVKDKEDSTQKSTEVIKNKEKEEEEEIEEEIEEEVEEKDDEEDEPEEEEKNQNETSINPLPEKTKDGLEISLELIKKFKEIPNEENDNSICNFILEKGLPMDVKDEHTLALILYFHKLCVSFYKILNSLKKKNIEKIFLSSLKESYFLFADDSIKHYNYKSLAKKIFPNFKSRWTIYLS